MTFATMTLDVIVNFPSYADAVAFGMEQGSGCFGVFGIVPNWQEKGYTTRLAGADFFTHGKFTHSLPFFPTEE